MATNPPEGMPRISPMLWYRDVASALDQLAKCFGFEQKMSMPGPDGSIMHAEMTVGESVLMLGPPDSGRGTARRGCPLVRARRCESKPVAIGRASVRLAVR